MQFTLKSHIYFCADMKAMAQFYTEVLGMKVIKNTQFSPDEWLELGNPGFKLCLHKAGKPGSPPHNRNKLVFHVEDVGTARDYLIAKKVRMGTHYRWPGMEASEGRDPEGNLFQIAGPPKTNQDLATDN